MKGGGSAGGCLRGWAAEALNSASKNDIKCALLDGSKLEPKKGSYSNPDDLGRKKIWVDERGRRRRRRWPAHPPRELLAGGTAKGAILLRKTTKQNWNSVSIPKPPPFPAAIRGACFLPDAFSCFCNLFLLLLLSYLQSCALFIASRRKAIAVSQRPRAALKNCLRDSHRSISRSCLGPGPSNLHFPKIQISQTSLPCRSHRGQLLARAQSRDRCKLCLLN